LDSSYATSGDTIILLDKSVGARIYIICYLFVRELDVTPIRALHMSFRHWQSLNHIDLSEYPTYYTLRSLLLYINHLNHTSQDGDVYASLTGRSADNARPVKDLQLTYHSLLFAYSYPGACCHLLISSLRRHRKSTAPQKSTAPRHMPFQH
jgi:hypothetical protein